MTGCALYIGFNRKKNYTRLKVCKHSQRKDVLETLSEI